MRAAVACVGVAGAIALTGCGGDDSGSTTSPGSSSTVAAESTNEVHISDFKFGPESVAVEAGAELTWTNSDDSPHTATADDSSFDTGDLDQGDSKSITFDEPGTFSYYCRFHPFMKATVEVR